VPTSTSGGRDGQAREKGGNRTCASPTPLSPGVAAAAASVQAELARDRLVRRVLAIGRIRHRQKAERDRQVEVRAFLVQIGGRGPL
jgi:hypothetical protein